MPLSDWLYIKVPQNPFSGLNNLLEWLTELRKTVYCAPVYYKEMKKHAGIQRSIQMEEVCR